MAEGDREGVGGVRWLRRRIEIKERLHHQLHLLLAAATVRGDELLDLERLIEGHRETGLGGREHGGGSRFTDGHGCPDVAENEVLDGDFIRAGVTDDGGNPVMDGEEPFGV